MSRQTRGAALAVRAEAAEEKLSSRVAAPVHPGFDEGKSGRNGQCGSPPAQGAALLDALYRQHRGWLLRVLRLRYGRDAAEDLLQETFLRAAAITQLAEVRVPRAWLLAIARNVARDQHRRAAVRPPAAAAMDPKALERLGVAPGQYEAILLKQVILALPLRLREVMLLSRFAGLTYEQIAERLGISVKTVEARMTRALAICSARLRS